MVDDGHSSAGVVSKMWMTAKRIGAGVVKTLLNSPEVGGPPIHFSAEMKFFDSIPELNRWYLVQCNSGRQIHQ